MRTVVVLSVLLCGVFACPVVGDDRKTAKPAADLPQVKELPNPFTFSDGSPVRNKDDWKRRREEIKSLFEDYQYGQLPAKPKKMTITRSKKIVDEDTRVTIQDLVVKLEQDDKSLDLNVRVAWPSEAKKAVPVLIRSTFGFGKGGAKAPSGKSFASFTKRGYGVAEFSFTQVAPDSKQKGKAVGIYHLFGDKIDTGALMAWAWGVHRVIDAIESVEELDAKKVIVTGHSRYGKAALVAGAFDDRIALTVPSHSGAGGSAPYRFIYGKSEQLHNIAGAFPYWFRPDFKQFVEKVDRLPVDQHLLLALVAPRPLLQSEGTKDSWTNPEGVQLTYQAAKKVYDFLKASDKISIRYRPVGHIPSNDDLLDYADFVFGGKKLPAEFGKLEYKEETKGFSWDVPK